MRVAIDTNGLYTTGAGTARYIRGLIHGLNQAQPAGMEFFELAWPVKNVSFRQPRRALKTIYRELIWTRTVAPGQLRQDKADLLHTTGCVFLVPPEPIRTVRTLHDLAVMRFPDRFRRWHHYSTVRRLKRFHEADRVICVSHFTAQEAIRLLGLSPSKIAVVYNGCDFHPNEPRPLEQKPGISVPSDFFLFVGSLEPGKNLALLKEAYYLARESGNPLPPLLIVGVRWAGVGTEGQPPEGWFYLGYQPDSVLVYLYRRALALAFPSKYEGFGLPVVEAMALGCPVICSPVASLPEVGGQAVLFAELQPEAFLGALRQMSSETNLRADCIEKGLAQARKFSWRQCAEETFDTYRRVMED